MALILAVVVGVLAWTLVEYVMHRFLGHVWPKRSRFGVLHSEHHRRQDYFAPAVEKAKLAVAVTVLVGALTVPLVGGGPGMAFSLTLVVCYLAYERVHRDLHVRAPSGAYGRWARRHHMIHHHTAPHHNHGVTSPVWDWVFGTLAPMPERVRIPAAKAPAWLAADAATFVADYDLFGRGADARAASGGSTVG